MRTQGLKMPVVATALFLFFTASCMQAPDRNQGFNGSWQTVAAAATDAASGPVRFQVDGDRFQASTDGRSFDAVINGDEAPVQGQPGLTVSVKRLPAVAVRQIFKRDGKPVEIVTVAVINRDTLLRLERQAASPPVLQVAERQPARP